MNFFRALALTALCAGMVATVSCNKDPEVITPAETIAVCGTVSDTYDNLLEGVAVAVYASSTSTEAIASATSEYDGTFALTVEKDKAGYVSFTKDGFSVVGVTISSSNIRNGVCFVNPVLEFAQAKITGRVLNALDGNAPFQGASVSNGGATVTTGADGVYTFENLTLQDYTLTISATGYQTLTYKVALDAFNEDGVAEIEDLTLGGVDILPGRSKQDLQNATKWYINEYRGGFGLGGDGSASDDDYGNATCSLMSGQFQNWYGLYEMQNEGCTLQIVDGNNETSGLQADLEHFDSYTYGSKLISEGNKILSVYWRTHQGANDNPVPWGVMVVDLSETEPAAVFVPEMDTKDKITYGYDSDWHTNYFDLSAYVGKEVIIAIGDFRREDNKCWYQFVLTHISFGPEKVVGHKALGLYGTPIAGLEGWRMSLEEAQSMMANTRTSFNASKGDLNWSANPLFGVWRGTGHIASEWGLQYVFSNCTPDCGEGFMLQTHNGNFDTGAGLYTAKPATYFYSKFNIDAAHDKMVFHARNFSSNNKTWFRVTAIDMDGGVHHITPSANTANTYEEGADSMVGFCHEGGWSGDIAGTASFTYDFSAFSGKDIVIIIGIYKNQADEQKLVFCGVDFE